METKRNIEKIFKPIPDIVKVYQDDYTTISISQKRCKVCEICSFYCPDKILEMTLDTAIITDIQKCNQCQMCELRCPDFAISVEVKERRKKAKKKTG